MLVVIVVIKRVDRKLIAKYISFVFFILSILAIKYVYVWFCEGEEREMCVSILFSLNLCWQLLNYFLAIKCVSLRLTIKYVLCWGIYRLVLYSNTSKRKDYRIHALVDVAWSSFFFQRKVWQSYSKITHFSILLTDSKQYKIITIHSILVYHLSVTQHGVFVATTVFLGGNKLSFYVYIYIDNYSLNSM